MGRNPLTGSRGHDEKPLILSKEDEGLCRKMGWGHNRSYVSPTIRGMTIGGNSRFSALERVLMVIAGVLSILMVTLTVGNAVTHRQPGVAVIGDSYTKGSGENSGTDTLWLTKVTKDLNLNATNLAEGGAGYVHPNSGKKTFATHVGAVKSNSDLVVVFGSLNDVEGYDKVKTAAKALYSTIHQETKAKLLVIGPTWPDGNPSPAVLESRNAVRDAAKESGDEFVDAIGWFAGTNGLIGGDGIHPNDAGHAYLVGKIEPIISSALSGQASK